MNNLKKNKYAILQNLVSASDIEKIINPFFHILYEKELSKSRTITKTWSGAEKIDLQFFKFVVLPDGRVDINLPSTLASKLLPSIELKLKLKKYDNLNIRSYNLIIHLQTRQNKFGIKIMEVLMLTIIILY